MDSTNWNGVLTTTGTSSNFIWSSGQLVSETKKRKFLWFKWEKKIKEMSVEEFFERAKYSKKELVIYDKVVDKYLKQIERANELGQEAIVEKMKDDIEVVKKEAVVAVKGIKHYLEKSQIETLMSKASKKIKITSVKNYTRFIPDEVASELRKYKEVFDDFVIVHYDSDNKGAQMTKKEIEKAKDPILFGVLSGIDNFYYIADWIDEYCNLTLKEVVKITGEKEKDIVPKEKINGYNK